MSKKQILFFAEQCQLLTVYLTPKEKILNFFVSKGLILLETMHHVTTVHTNRLRKSMF